MRYLSLLFLAWWIGLWTSPAAARTLTLLEAQSAAEKRAQTIQIAARQAQVVGAEVQIAGALANPNLTLLTTRLSPRLSAGLSVPLPLFGQRGKAVAAARADSAVAAIGVVLARNEARYGITAAWLDLWAAQQQAQLLDSAAAAADRFRDIAQERFAAGSTPRLDVIRTTAESARAAAEATAAKSAIRAAAARLLPWLGNPPDSEPTDGDFLVAAGEPTPVELAVPGLAELRATAMTHPNLVRDHAQSTAALMHVRSEQRQRWPVVSGLITVTVGDPSLPGTDVIGGVSLDLPVLNVRGGAIARARAQEAVAQASLELDVRRTLADVQEAYYSLQAAAGRARTLRAQVLPAISEAAQLTEESYKNGRADLVRLLEAQHAVVETRLVEVSALATFGKTVADLERAVGRSLDAP